MGYARVVARRRTDVKLDEPVEQVSNEYTQQPLLRASTGGEFSSARQ
jgi:hypothetical protein